MLGKSLLKILIFRLFSSEYEDENYQFRLKKIDDFTKRKYRCGSLIQRFSGKKNASKILLPNFERVKQVSRLIIEK